MSISEKLTKLNTDISSAYNSIETKGGTVPVNKNTENLASAIESIEGGGGNTPNFIEYIESTGTQYIDTGYLVNNNSEFVLNGYTIDGTFFGSGISGKYYSIGLIYHTGVYRARWRNSVSTNADIVSTIPCDTTRHTFKINKTSFYIDDVLIGNLNSTYNFTETNTVYIFGWNSDNTVMNMPTSARIYSFKIYDNGTLVRNFKPCIDPNGVYCLYELVEGKYYYNQGTGSFKGSGIPTQVKNYLMLYDGSLGEAGENGANVCADVTGGFSLMISSGSANLTYNRDHALLANTGSNLDNSAFMVNNLIDLTDYKLLSGIALVNTSKYVSSAIAVRNIKGYGNAGLSGSTGISTSTNRTTISQDQNAEFIGEKFAFDSDISSLNSGYPYFANFCESNSKSTLKIYSMFLVKEDNWQELCTLAGLTSSDYTDEATLCADSTAISTILNNEEAVKYMIYNCTGTFMLEFINSSVALAELNLSSYKTLIYGNEVWLKFLIMIV